MFSGLASLFFGSKKNDTDYESNSLNEQQGSTLNTEEDDGWILVDKKSKETDEEIVDHNSEEDFGELLSHFLFETNCDYEQDFENIKPSLSSSPSPSTPSSLAQLDPDGSWYLTPPPCFTAGNAPSNTQVSPMENLLIEHPSMSVYIRNGPVQESTRNVPLITQEQGENHAIAGKNSSRKNGKHPSSRSKISSIAERAELIITQGLGKCILEQKAEKFFQSKALRRSQMNRSNKVREYASSNNTQHRKDRMRNICSGMNNNRKC